MKLVDVRGRQTQKKTFNDLPSGAVFVWKHVGSPSVILMKGYNADGNSIVVLCGNCAGEVILVDGPSRHSEVQELDAILTISEK